MDSPIPIYVVSGLPRSGTSLMMQLLTAGGLPALTDDQRPPDHSNPRGYFEFQPVKAMARDTHWIDLAQGKVVKIISQLLPYLPDHRTYRVILMERAMDEVLRSQASMLGQTWDPAATALAQAFARHARQARQLLETKPNFSALVVQHRELLQDPQAVIGRLVEFVDTIQLDPARMGPVVDPALYRARSQV